MAFTADEAQALLQALREIAAEPRIGEWAREIALERAEDADLDERRQRQAEERARDAQGSSQAKYVDLIVLADVSNRGASRHPCREQPATAEPPCRL